MLAQTKMMEGDRASHINLNSNLELPIITTAAQGPAGLFSTPVQNLEEIPTAESVRGYRLLERDDGCEERQSRMYWLKKD